MLAARGGGASVAVTRGRRKCMLCAARARSAHAGAAAVMGNAGSARAKGGVRPVVAVRSAAYGGGARQRQVKNMLRRQA